MSCISTDCNEICGKYGMGSSKVGLNLFQKMIHWRLLGGVGCVFSHSMICYWTLKKQLVLKKKGLLCLKNLLFGEVSNLKCALVFIINTEGKYAQFLCKMESIENRYITVYIATSIATFQMVY